MKTGQILFLSILLLSRVAKADSGLSPATLAIAHWIGDRQFQNPALPSYGAIANADGPTAIGADGQRYYSVSPYSANLAVIGLLQSRAPNGWTVAERWIDWYFGHLNSQSAPDGVPYNHFYRANGDGETTCVKPGDSSLCHYNDATDSAAATFFLVLQAAYEAHASSSLFNTPERKKRVEKLATLVLNLQQSDGLCWAKSDYHVKYVEDNSEVFAGLCALANLERDVFHDAQRSAKYHNVSERVRRGILTELYDPKARLFCVAKFENGDHPAPNLNTWYPDTQAQLWPVLFGVIAPNDSRARGAAAMINNHWNGRVRPDWARDPQHVNQGWAEAGHACAALLMSDTNRVQRYLEAVKRYKFKSKSKKPQFTGPFSVDDAGWLLRILDSSLLILCTQSKAAY
ncbi:MAG TPA: hypothetical protein VH280_02890 [Verrucomicrobiae bacterium]|jgi:GH15 family glucan-1,4-alpha-glucosidase|nr:hypothetical protein [Verrucomicrobiae bacterium]